MKIPKLKVRELGYLMVYNDKVIVQQYGTSALFLETTMQRFTTDPDYMDRYIQSMIECGDEMHIYIY